MTENKELFYYDQVLEIEQFCNFSSEKEYLLKAIENGECTKLYGPRNFGKTSLARNIVAKIWEAKNIDKRVVVYADLYSVTDLNDLSLELTKAFTKALNSKKNILDKGLEWLKVFKNIRPAWTPSSMSDGLGEFSLTTEKSEQIINFQIILENIHHLQKSGKFEFLIIFDEFQEIHKIKRAEALLRSSLQFFSIKIPVIILGSKQHLLKDIFESPRAPFYSWGNTIEFHPIPFKEYHSYIEERFSSLKMTHSLETSIFLQTKMNRIPESINRFCSYLCKTNSEKEITIVTIENELQQFVDRSRSIYEHIFSNLSSSERKIIETISKNEKITQVLGKDFLSSLKDVSKSTVSNVVHKLLDQAILSQGIDEMNKKYFWITDPFFNYFVKHYKI